MNIDSHPLVLINAIINAPSERRTQKAPSFLKTSKYHYTSFLDIIFKSIDKEQTSN
jgi:hypothetical protein